MCRFAKEIKVNRFKGCKRPYIILYKDGQEHLVSGCGRPHQYELCNKIFDLQTEVANKNNEISKLKAAIRQYQGKEARGIVGGMGGKHV